MTVGDRARGDVVRALAMLGVLALAGVAFYIESWQVLAARWMQFSLGYDHGWLIAAMAVWLAWRQRELLAAGSPWWPGLVLVLGAGTGWLMARAADVAIGQEILLPVLLWSAALTAFGRTGGRALLFPIGFLYFAIPVWDYANPFLQSATTAVVGACLGPVGVPALIEGNYVTIPAGRFEIASGCAGQAFFVTAGALAALYGHLYYDRLWKRRALLIAIALAGAMVVNWLRVWIVILSGHLTNMQHYFVREDHYTFGWGLFAVALVPFFLLARRLEPPAEAPSRPAGGGTAGRLRTTAVVAALAALAAAPAAWAFVDSRAGSAPAEPGLPAAPAGWERAAPGGGWQPAYRGADARLAAGYRQGERAVDLHVVWYARQAQGKELVYYANSLGRSGEWQVRDQGEVAGDPQSNQALLTARDGEQRLVRWWYEVAGRHALGAVEAKLQQVAGRLTGRSDAALVAVSSACRPDCDAAEAALDAWQDAMPIVRLTDEND